MTLRCLAAAALLCSASAARATEWWWIGTESNPDALAYVDRALIQPTDDGRMEAFLLEIYGAPLANGATRAVAVYRIDCRNRHYERIGEVAQDEEGHQLAAIESAPPTGTIPRGTVGYGVYGMACGRLSGNETRVEDPFAHAGGYFHRVYATRPGAQRPQEGGPAQGAPPQGAAQDDGQRPGAPHEQAPAGMAFGTGFFVGPEGYALTAYHVVDGATRIACRTGDGAVHEAVLARMSQANDIALLRVDFRPPHSLGFAPRGSLRPGERVFTIGYGAPNFLGVSEPRFTEGTVSALSGLDADDSFVQISVPIQPGNSGGPLVNEAGQVVGIISSSAGPEAFQRMEGAAPQNINWAVKADYATPLLPPQPPAPARGRAQAIALAHDSVCLVVAEREGDER
jgi:S1-C subfamily serine protease